MQKKYDALVLFSGGLDSILAARILQDQGFSVLCVHYTSPFFGNAARIPFWQKRYGLDIYAEDISRDFVAMLAKGPEHGTGSALNPCIDCKILMMRKTCAMLTQTGASFMASGEVLGQRPMSQRADALNTIKKQGLVENCLLRPLSGGLLPPTPMETSGIIHRENLLKISGRGRNEQLELAKKMGIFPVPAPAGGCKLTEMENTRRYWQIIRQHWDAPQEYDESATSRLLNDIRLANAGRHVFKETPNGRYWLCIGRNKTDNDVLSSLCAPDDALVQLAIPGPIAIARGGAEWPMEILREASGIVASYQGKIKNDAIPVVVRLSERSLRWNVNPDRRGTDWFLPEWQTVREEMRAARKNKFHSGNTGKGAANPGKKARHP